MLAADTLLCLPKLVPVLFLTACRNRVQCWYLDYLLIKYCTYTSTPPLFFSRLSSPSFSTAQAGQPSFNSTVCYLSCNPGLPSFHPLFVLRRPQSAGCARACSSRLDSATYRRQLTHARFCTALLSDDFLTLPTPSCQHTCYCPSVRPLLFNCDFYIRPCLDE